MQHNLRDRKILIYVRKQIRMTFKKQLRYDVVDAMSETAVVNINERAKDENKSVI